MKNFISRKPIIFSVVMVVCYFILTYIISFLWRFPVNDYTSIAYELLFIALPFLMVCFFGDKSVYRQGGFFKSLTVGGYMFYSQLFLLAVMAFSSVYSPDNKWAGASTIVYGVVMLFGVGFREESIFRGIIVNIIGKKYIKNRSGILLTAAASGAVFGLIHMTNIFAGVNLTSAVIQSVVACGIGFYLAAVYLRGGSLWAMILLHILADGASMFTALFTADNGTVVDAIDSLSIINLTPFFVCTAIGLFILRRSKCGEIIEKFNPEIKEAVE